MIDLPGFILSFRPSLLSGVLFYLTCMIGSISVIGTILVLFYGSWFVFYQAVRKHRRAEIQYRAHERRRIVNQRLHID